MAREFRARAGSASVALATAVLTVVALTFVLVLSTTGGNNSTPRLETPGPAVTTSASLALPPATSTCTAPPLPIQKLSQVGTPPFALVGAKTACAVVTSSAPGSGSLADITLTLNVATPLRLTMIVDVNNNGTSTVPDGTTFTATYGTQTIIVYDNLHPVQAKAAIVTIPSGEATMHFRALVPNPYKSGSYYFTISIFASYESSGSQQIYSDSFPVNLDAQ